jgi:hypothetical protein
VQHRLDAHCGKDPRSVDGKDIALAPRIASDHDTTIGRFRNGVEQPLTKAGRSLPDDQPIHPHRPRCYRRSEAGSSELQSTSESVGELNVVTRLGQRDQLIEFGADVIIRFSVEPCPSACQ